MFKNKTFVIIGIILLLSIVLNFALYTQLGYAFGGDQNLVVPNLSSLYNSLFVWSFYNYTGLIAQTGSILSLLFGFSIIIIYRLFGIIWGYIIFTSIYYWIFGFGIFLLVYRLTKDLDHNSAYIAGLFAAIIAIFEFDSHLKTLTAGIIFLPYVVLFTYFIIKNFESESNNSINLIGLVISISFLLASGGGTYIIQNLMFLLFFALFIFLILPRQHHFRFLKYTCLATISSVLINISWIFPTYIFTKSVGSQYFNAGSVNTLSVLSSTSITALFGFGSINSYLSGLVLLSIFLIAVIGFLKALEDKTKRRLEFGISLALLSIYLIFVIFGTGINKPFGILFANGVKLIPYLLVFRYTYFATHYIFLFIMATLFGVGIAYVVKFARGNKNKILSFSIYALLFLVLITYLYSFDYLQISGTTKTVIPEHVFNISNYINSQQGIFSIATLPMALGWQSTNWYTGTNVYSSLVNKPTYTGSYTYYNEIFFPVSTSLYADGVGSEVDFGNASKISISNGFGVFGIHYIIVQGDALNKSICEYCYIPPFSFNTIYSNLNNSKGIFFVKRFGNSSVYRNDNYVPLVYGSDLIVLRNASSVNIMDIIEGDLFNIKNTSVYSNNISGFYNDSNTINATRISNFSMPNISFVENTPTKVTVDVSNATTPYYLVFRETYDTHWVAYYSNGTAVPERDHIMVNGFANAWYIDRPGSYTITLYYTLQTETWIAWVISFAALFATVGIGIYGWRADKMSKRKRGAIRRSR
jgi:hypothetical protein